MKKICFWLIPALLLIIAACHNQEQKAAAGKLRVVTTIFPLYDFARQIGKDRIDLNLLLPPGVEPHSFEPKPADIVNINRADLFVYTNKFMEPWAAQIISGLDAQKIRVIDTSRGIPLHRSGAEPGTERTEEAHHHDERIDPHIWLDFANAQLMVDNILAGFTAKDPANASFYTANAAAFKAELKALDDRYRAALAQCPKRLFLHGGHYAFGYLARRYGLEYQSAYAVNADAEPTPAKLAALIRQLRKAGLKHIYTEELLNPQVAETIARETGATLLPLHGAHNISKDDLARGVTFLSLMAQNLDNLQKGLQCR